VTDIRSEPTEVHARDLAARSMHWFDGCWDDAVKLARKPPDPGETGVVHVVRSTAWYALGLLMRDGDGDHDRALEALDSVLAHQYDAPGRPHHGTFLRSPDDPPVPDEPKVWRDYDPNWREFVGTTLALILIEYEARLPEELVGRIDTALRRAIDGTLARGLRAGYTNIALMSAWLRVFAGQRFGEPEWAADGERLAGEVVVRFRASGAFDEYNSPTYYGVNLFALAVWRGYGGSPLLREAGAELEAAVWRDMARFYHAGMRNLAGPYDRSYGMDMRQYFAAVGMAFWVAAGRDHAPLPDLEHPFVHGWDFGMGPLVALAGTRVPDDALPHLTGFRGEREVEQLIVPEPRRRVASAWLGERVMLGGDDSGRRMRAKEQFHPATIHWLTPDGEVAWIRLRHEVPVDVRAERGRLTIEAAEPAELTFEIGGVAGDVRADRWELPGLTVDVGGDTTAFSDDPTRYTASRLTLSVESRPSAT
jgi:hypothetical protein